MNITPIRLDIVATSTGFIVMCKILIVIVVVFLNVHDFPWLRLTTAQLDITLYRALWTTLCTQSQQNLRMLLFTRQCWHNSQCLWITIPFMDLGYIMQKWLPFVHKQFHIITVGLYSPSQIIRNRLNPRVEPPTILTFGTFTYMYMTHMMTHLIDDQ